MNENYRQGDIVLFKGGNEWLDVLIKFFSESEYTHSAILYAEDRLVEVVGPGIMLNPVKLVKGDQVKLMRLKNGLDVTPVIQHADKYLEMNIKYDYAGLLMLAGLALFRKIKPTDRVLRSVYEIVKSLILWLDSLIQKVSGQKSMQCSQFVYQVHCDCQGDYVIQLDDPYFGAELLPEDGTQICLGNYQNEGCSGYRLEELLGSEKESLVSSEELARKFYEALTHEGDEVLGENDDLMKKTIFLSNIAINKLNQVLSDQGMDIPLNSLFVTPGDLERHAVNLEPVGTWNLERK